MIAEKYISSVKDDTNINTMISYCKSLKYYLLNIQHNKYESLFVDVCDVCTNLTLKFDPGSRLKYISENINIMANLKTNKMIDLDNFIIKRIKKNTYQSLIANDVGSSAESDDDYGDDFDFSKDDMPSEDDDWIFGTLNTKKNISKKDIVEV